MRNFLCVSLLKTEFSRFINILGHSRGKIMTEMVHKSNETKGDLKII